jgi:hypothetical protein
MAMEVSVFWDSRSCRFLELKNVSDQLDVFIFEKGRASTETTVKLYKAASLHILKEK